MMMMVDRVVLDIFDGATTYNRVEAGDDSAPESDCGSPNKERVPKLESDT